MLSEERLPMEPVVDSDSRVIEFAPAPVIGQRGPSQTQFFAAFDGEADRHGNYHGELGELGSTVRVMINHEDLVTAITCGQKVLRYCLPETGLACTIAFNRLDFVE